jgi:hypothetical protein
VQLVSQYGDKYWQMTNRTLRNDHARYAAQQVWRNARLEEEMTKRGIPLPPKPRGETTDGRASALPSGFGELIRVCFSFMAL